MGDTMKLTAWMSIPEFARVSGLKTDAVSVRKLRNRIRAIEAIRGVKLIWPINAGRTNGQRFGVTLSNLKRYAPELFDTKEERIEGVANQIRSCMADIYERLDRNEDNIEAVRDLAVQISQNIIKKGAA